MDVKSLSEAKPQNSYFGGCFLLKGPIFDLFSDLFLLSQTLVEQLHMIVYQKTNKQTALYIFR